MNVKLFFICFLIVIIAISTIPLQQVSGKGFIYGGQSDLRIYLSNSGSPAYDDDMYIPKENLDVILDDIDKLPVLVDSMVFPSINEQLLKHESQIKDHYLQNIVMYYNMNEDTFDKNEMEIWINSQPDLVHEIIKVEPAADAKMEVVKHLALMISVYANITYYEYEDILKKIEKETLQRAQLLAIQARETLRKHNDELLASVLDGEGSLANKIRIQTISMKMLEDVARVTVSYPVGKEGLKFIDETKTRTGIESFHEFQVNSIMLGEPQIVTESSPLLEFLLVGWELIIQSELKSIVDDDMQITYIVQVKDQDDVTVSLSWVQAPLQHDTTINAALRWTPESAGEYMIETFVWSDLNRPVPLAISRDINITVASR